MIIDIALGIVLAVLILRYWPALLAMGTFATVSAVILAIGGVVVYILATNEALLQKVSTIAVLVVTYVVGGFVARLIAKRTVLSASEVGVLITIAIFLGNATVFFFWFISKWATQANDPLLYLYLFPLLALWALVWLRLSALVKSRRVEKV